MKLDSARRTRAGITPSVENASPTKGWVTKVYSRVALWRFRLQMRHLSTALPAYMLPTRWIRLDSLPKNQNGKIDRRQLKELFDQGAGHAA